MFFREMERVFNNLPLNIPSNEENLKVCLKYLNLLNSEKCIVEKIKNIPELSTLNPFNNIEKVWEITLPYIFSGHEHNNKVKLYSLQRTNKFDFSTIENFLKYLNTVTDNEMVCEFFKITFENTISEDRMIWLTEYNINDVEELIMKLGLYHMETATVKDSFFLFEFELEKFFKPTWIDAGFVFYFNSQSEEKDYGVTLNLQNGYDGVKEYITQRSNLELKKISVLYPKKTIKAYNLSDVFWENIKSKIEQKKEESL